MSLLPLQFHLLSVFWWAQTGYASQFQAAPVHLMRNEAIQEESWTVPKLPATTDETDMCESTSAYVATSGVSPYWKETDATSDDVRKVEGTHPITWANCLAGAKLQCLVATAVLWGESGKICNCLYGDVNPSGSGKKKDFVCKFKKAYVTGNICKDGYFKTGQVKDKAQYKQTKLKPVSRSLECAKEAKAANCDAAEMPRGRTGSCTCMNQTKDFEGTSIHVDPTKTTHGTCIINTS
mmetsp:Transcript_68124/g.142314  ORF Transcript_68124/g.142314 Transcript_68124/m.142314 type:complete len:237 (+) Transcript_68124:356-1066(+)|eukprot:CAMPEP_0206466502 /NCGR_PEP_ID=MMETSP0324_2-20121206/28493_1 /ASSEMBLY_ACC=CAM_ASM_000836 /TAXON_ID=2866 /ORGANISM="Crypthecodinium cohnii, Strain Seligo" /LENGTH=236 /DNA_ID=CAMNT_0053939623 /DNA_START=343 /DNA_END=1053 /DNA_ORIENTATION=-